MEGEIVIKRWEDLDGEVSSYRLCCLLSTLPPMDSPWYSPSRVNSIPRGLPWSSTNYISFSAFSYVDLICILWANPPILVTSLPRDPTVRERPSTAGRLKVGKKGIFLGNRLRCSKITAAEFPLLVRGCWRSKGTSNNLVPTTSPVPRLLVAAFLTYGCSSQADVTPVPFPPSNLSIYRGNRICSRGCSAPEHGEKASIKTCPN